MRITYVLFTSALGILLFVSGCGKCDCATGSFQETVNKRGGAASSGSSQAQAPDSETEPDLGQPLSRTGSSNVSEGDALAIAMTLAEEEGYDMEVWTDIVINRRGPVWVVTFQKPRSRNHFLVNVQQKGGAAELILGR